MEIARSMYANESVVWEGRKSKKVSLLEGVFNKMLPFALLWGAIDFGVIGSIKSDVAMPSQMGAVFFGFFALHLMPVWIYLFGVITAGLQAKNTHYLITDKTIYVQRGIFSVTTTSKPISDVLHVTVHQGVIDRMFGTGDVICECNHIAAMEHHDHTSIENIEDYERVFEILKNIQNTTYENMRGTVAF